MEGYRGSAAAPHSGQASPARDPGGGGGRKMRRSGEQQERRVGYEEPPRMVPQRHIALIHPLESDSTGRLSQSGACR
jgi:hypothetical protein